MGRGNPKRSESGATCERRAISAVLERPACEHVGTIERATSKGIPVSIDLYRDVEEDNRGWRVDMLLARTESGPAGYLKIGVITKENMESHYETIFHYATQILGVGNYGLSAILRKPYAQWDRSEMLLVLERTDPWNHKAESRAELPDEEIRAALEIRRSEYEKRYGEEFERFREWQTDNPYVEFIRVYESRDSVKYADGPLLSDNADLSGIDFRNKGIGSAMYETAAMWMHSEGMNFHGSSNQSPEAQAVWEGFERRGIVREVPGNEKCSRRVIDVDALAATSPEIWEEFQQQICE